MLRDRSMSASGKLQRSVVVCGQWQLMGKCCIVCECLLLLTPKTRIGGSVNEQTIIEMTGKSTP
jgi:hypothetical protein